MSNPADASALAPNESRFARQAQTVEDRLKADTIGLVHLSDFRKRRAEAVEAAQDTSSGATTPEGPRATHKTTAKKRKAAARKVGLSFNDGDEAEEDGGTTGTTPGPRAIKEKSTAADEVLDGLDEQSALKKRGFRPNATVAFQPKAMTKSALSREAQIKESLKKEYTQLQEAVKATEIVVPFVFYDGKNVPGGVCRMKKGDFIWLFLERARKVGAGLAGEGDRARKDWARISVDDLMVVKDDLIIPHHYEFHYFIINRTHGYHGQLFPYSSEPTATTPKHLLPNSSASAPTPEAPAGLLTAAQRAEQAASVVVPDDSELEGFEDDPSLTKVVDRRWYERNKHIFPASTWENFDPEKDYSVAFKKDAQGNAMFFSR